MKRENVGTGFIFGLVVGGAAALLLAPRSGRETREKLGKMVEENRDLLHEARESSERLISKTRETIEDLMQRLGRGPMDPRAGSKGTHAHHDADATHSPEHAGAL